MKENAHKFGFINLILPVVQLGIKEEKWHWTYLPLSKQYTQQIQQIITDEMINGFAGSEYSDQLDIVERYILGIADRWGRIIYFYNKERIIIKEQTVKTLQIADGLPKLTCLFGSIW